MHKDMSERVSLQLLSLPSFASVLLATQAIGCTEKFCSGSLMNWKHQSSSGRTSRSTEDVIRLAQNFMDQYYTSIKRLHSRSHEQRWKEVLNEIKSTASYELRETELIFGAKLAWRNAARCIGRIQWSKLQVGPLPARVEPRPSSRVRRKRERQARGGRGDESMQRASEQVSRRAGEQPAAAPCATRAVIDCCAADRLRLVPDYKAF